MSKFLPKWTKALGVARVRAEKGSETIFIRKKFDLDWSSLNTCLVGEAYDFPYGDSIRCSECTRLGHNLPQICTSQGLRQWKLTFLNHLKEQHPNVYTKWSRRMR